MRALISTANHEGLIELAQELHNHTVSMFATENTLKVLAAEGIHASSVSELSRFPEILEDEISALHPIIIGGIVARRDLPRHIEEMSVHGIDPIDLVIVNLYPFAALAHHPDTTPDEVLARVDVGGIALIRAAAKNFRDVIVLTRPEDYASVMQEWSEQGEVSLETRRRLAITAFQYTATYDTAIAEYLRMAESECFPSELTLPLERLQTLRYGENPHQQAAFYRWSGYSNSIGLPTVAGAQFLHGKHLSFNNLLDLDVALGTVQCFTAPTVAIIKHTNPCGLACDDVLLEAYKKAHACDPIASNSGVIGSNRPINEVTAHEMSQLSYEAIIAPEFSPEAVSLLRKRPQIRLLATNCAIEPRAISSQALHHAHPEVRSISGGLLLQTPDIVGERESEYSVVSEREPTLDEVTNLMFAWKAVRRVKSNAVVLARKLMLVGIGAGQMSRVSSVQLAVEKAASRARGTVLASDAAFPFADAVEAAARAGITAIIQPGGSERDEDVIREANHYAIALIFTGKRHYRH
ncbi:MAG TPA: bifunctional phosphoribosylaminoimidazolecarboxamide formyltransferase/IMP cyclohydrolase [Ktedonobacteraceae bacterium]|jgi:phosphoribosylaminoimidazolecarboxamide formyltransferase/IMP cyclohydrolase|nr:bifunctional phosphoribosylaminoimidazolecarboxamide formyltransferase/IMP cyclohydrolase [Ktedonobacteraceae bacterium]